MPQVARRHHFIPRFLLREFADEAGELWVTDICSSKQCKRPPRAVAYELDYHRVETYHYPPDFLEGLISSIENRAAPIACDIRATCKFPQDIDRRRAMLDFIALQMVRTPTLRRGLKSVSESAAQGLLDLAFDNRHLGYQILKAYNPGIGIVDVDSISRDSMHFPTADRTPEMLTMSVAFRKLALPCVERLEGLTLTSAAGRFISSDFPVVADSPLQPSRYVFLALSPYVALGGFAKRLNSDSWPLPFTLIADWNGRLVDQSTRVYSRIDKFPWLDRDGNVRKGI